MPATSKVEKKKGSRKPYHHALLKEALIDTAIRLTTERDGPDFSLRELATALGVSHTAVYRHFTDKDALLDELTQGGFAELSAAQKHAQSLAGPAPLDQLRALCMAYVGFARDYPGYFALMFHSRPGSARVALGRDVHNSEPLMRLVDTIRACQAAGDIIAGDPERIAAYIALAPHGMCSYVARGHVPAFIARQHTDLDQTAAWIAEIGIDPFLTHRMPADRFAAYFATPTQD